MLLRLARAPALAAPAARRLAPAAIASRRHLSDAVATKTAAGAVSTETKPKTDNETMQAFTGAPAGMLETRIVKIYQQAQTVQNATANMIPWRLQWEDDQTKRWTNPLMGWTSTSDPLSNTHRTLEFNTPEDAARFCEQNGWKYEIEASKPSNEMTNGPKKYADNFTWKGPKGRDFPDLYKPPPPPPPPPKS
jgi:hypothetical protein